MVEELGPLPNKRQFLQFLISYQLISYSHTTLLKGLLLMPQKTKDENMSVKSWVI